MVLSQAPTVLPCVSPGKGHEGFVFDKQQQTKQEFHFVFLTRPPHPPILTNPPAHPTQKQQSQMQEMLRQLSQQQQRVQSNTETVHMVTSCSARSPPEEGDMSKQTASSW